jgi:hypothetical protein
MMNAMLDVVVLDGNPATAGSGLRFEVDTKLLRATELLQYKGVWTGSLWGLSS